MRSRSFIVALFAVFILILAAQEVFTNTNGAPAARSGGPGESTCATSSCHAGTLNSGPGLVSLSSDAPNGIYTPGNTYVITATVQQAGLGRFGFEVLSGYNAALNRSVGLTSITSPGETKTIVSGQRRYVTHVTGGSLGSGSRSWTFSWTAPDPGVGDVSFHMAGNAANNNSNRTGDQIYTTNLTLVEAAVGVDDALQHTEMVISPSITSERLLLQLHHAGLSSFRVEILAPGGGLLRELTLHPAGTELRHELPVADLAAGLYYVRVTGESFSATQKFLKF